MSTAIFQESTTEEQAEMRAKIDASLADLKRFNAGMAQDRLIFSRLSSGIQEAASESRRIMAKTQEILAHLEAS